MQKRKEKRNSDNTCTNPGNACPFYLLQGAGGKASQAGGGGGSSSTNFRKRHRNEKLQPKAHAQHLGIKSRTRDNSGSFTLPLDSKLKIPTYRIVGRFPRSIPQSSWESTGNLARDKPKARSQFGQRTSISAPSTVPTW